MSSNSSSGFAEPLTKGEIEAWCVVYGVESFLTVFGNAIAILVFLITPSLHKRTYYLLVSLAVADFLVGALAIPMFIYVLGAFYKVWPMKTDLQEAQQILEVGVSYASIYSLTAIAIERMLAIMLPWKHSIESRASYIAAIIITWALSLMTAAFIVFYRINADVRMGFFVTIMVLLGLCLLTTFVCYMIIVIKLLGKDSLSSLPNREHRETQLAITLLLVSIFFLVTWLPFKVINHIFYFDQAHAATLSYHYVLATKLLHYFNSLVNPFIYAFRIPDFKRGLRNLFCCCSTSSEPDPNKGANGAWHVKGISGPQSATYPDHVSMTTV